MGRKAMLGGLVLSVLLVVLADRSFSRARGPQTPAEQQRWIQDQQRKAEQERLKNREKQKAAQQEALGATAEQWQTIQSRLEAVKKIAGRPVIRLSVYGSGGGSSTSSSFSSSSGGTGGSGTGGGFASGGAGGFGGAGGSGSGGGGSSYSGQASGNASAGGNVSGGGQGGSFAGGGSAGSAGGYGFGFGGPPGPVKKQVGEVSLGWQWQRPSLNKSPGQWSESEKVCERLLDVLETKDPDREQVR
jgi:hypothetical protein